MGYLKHDFLNQNLNQSVHWFKKHLMYAEFEKDRYFLKEETKIEEFGTNYLYF